MKIASVECEWRIKSQVIVVFRFVFYGHCVLTSICTHTHAIRIRTQWREIMLRLSHSGLRSPCVLSFSLFLLFLIAEKRMKKVIRRRGDNVVRNIFAVPLHAKQTKSKINILYSILWTIYFYCLVTY